MSETKTEQQVVRLETAPRAEILPIEIDTEARLADQIQRMGRAALVERVQTMTDGEEFMRRRMSFFRTVRLMCLKATVPEDWTGYKQPDGTVLYTIRVSGADKIAPLLGVEIDNMRPTVGGTWQPQAEADGDETQLRAWFDCACSAYGNRFQDIEIAKSSSESFAGRGAISTTTALVATSDLRSSLYALMRRKAVSILGGFARVSAAELQASGIDVGKAGQGAGFGSSKDRRTDAATGGNLKAEQKALGDDVLARVGGDIDAAKSLMIEITAWPEGKRVGVDSAGRIGSTGALNAAWAKLRQHPVFGDSAQRGERDPGAD